MKGAFAIMIKDKRFLFSAATHPAIVHSFIRRCGTGAHAYWSTLMDVAEPSAAVAQAKDSKRPKAPSVAPSRTKAFAPRPPLIVPASGKVAPWFRAAKSAQGSAQQGLGFTYDTHGDPASNTTSAAGTRKRKRDDVEADEEDSDGEEEDDEPQHATEPAKANVDFDLCYKGDKGQIFDVHGNQLKSSVRKAYHNWASNKREELASRRAGIRQPSQNPERASAEGSASSSSQARVPAPSGPKGKGKGKKRGRGYIQKFRPPRKGPRTNAPGSRQ